MDGDDELRARGILFQFLTQRRHVHVDGARDRRGVIAPHSVEQLTAAQRTAWDGAQADFRAATHPLFEKRAALGEQAETALKEKSDACTIGGLMLSMQTVLDQIRNEESALQQKLVLTLTPDQKTRYEAFRAAQGGARRRESSRD